jgi:hypothetical protein
MEAEGIRWDNFLIQEFKTSLDNIKRCGCEQIRK